jgi:hypothetical protein
MKQVLKAADYCGGYIILARRGWKIATVSSPDFQRGLEIISIEYLNMIAKRQFYYHQLKKKLISCSAF